MDRRRMILLVAMVLLVPVIFILLRNMGPGQEPAAPPPQPEEVVQIIQEVDYASVLVASSDIPFGTRLNETHFSWREWPRDNVNPAFITQDNRRQAMQELTGAVARAEFFAGDPITERKIVMPGENSVMSALLSPGMRAVTTRISVDTAAGGFIQPGDRVDIILTSSMTGTQATGSSGRRYMAETIFENVRVLAIDQNFSSESQAGAFVIGSTATFEMTQRDAELLQQSVAQGDLSLTLRPIGRQSTPGSSRASVKRNSGDVSSMTIYRDGQPTQVAIRGQ